MKESLGVRALDQRLQNVAGKDQILAYRLRVTVTNVVVGQDASARRGEGRNRDADPSRRERQQVHP